MLIMRKGNMEKLNKLSTGLTTFMAAGVLVFAILSDNDGSDTSQQDWDYVSKHALALDKVSVESRFAVVEDEALSWVDPVVTGSVKSKKDLDVEPLSVLSIIRQNSDVNPGVSSGTDRVSITVKPGDTLFKLGQKYGLSVAELAGMNNLAEPFTIRVGQTLYIAR